ncbi:MAG TPA: RHS repeat-associated core domain-containing protein, partial [Candidatus Acidoferrum sp.]|nr:RHS repeat-associated core domain-containing protein [Candidatus Acidoferrum sp.]
RVFRAQNLSGHVIGVGGDSVCATKAFSRLGGRVTASGETCGKVCIIVLGCGDWRHRSSVVDIVSLGDASTGARFGDNARRSPKDQSIRDIGRALGATNYLGSTTKFVSAATYAPPGELASATLGATSNFTGIVTNNTYSDRLQPILLSAAVTGQSPVFSECFDFHLGVAVNNSPCSFSAYTSGDNGNVYQIVNNRNTARSDVFMYDSLNRIQQAYSSGSGSLSWGETFGPTATSPGTAPSTPGIDSWGNLTNRAGVTGKTYFESMSCPANTKNQLTTCSYGYDAAGNMTSSMNASGPVSYTYDAENRLIATEGYSYIYDGDGQRVEKCTEGSTAGSCATGATGTLYWRGLSSDALSETNLSGTVQNTYVFFNGQRVARLDSGGAVHYYFSDHLGSHGVVENATATTCEQDIDYYTYGGVENDYCPNVAQNYKFTGKERDAESSLDNFGVRYNASTMGRFMSPDPGNISLNHLLNPQKWNKYAYTLNNPLRFFDPDGMQEMEIQFRAFIKQESVGDPFGRTFAGDNRSFTVGQNVTSRTTITVRIETDASKRPGNPIISITQPGKAGKTIQLDDDGKAVKKDEAKTGLPTVTGFRDASGNAVLQFVQNTKDPIEWPQFLTPGVQADLGVTVGQNGSWVEASGLLSATPSFELNVQDSDGNMTNIPLQSEPSGAAFGLGLFLPLGIENITPLLPPPPPPNAGSGCGFANKTFCFI